MTDTASAAPSEREKFEVWLPPYWPRETYRDDEGDELYCDSWVQGAWMGWRGRAAQPTPPAQGDAEDAARYRCIRRGQHWSVIDGIGNELRAEALDATIDAARAHAKEGSPK